MLFPLNTCSFIISIRKNLHYHCYPSVQSLFYFFHHFHHCCESHFANSCSTNPLHILFKSKQPQDDERNACTCRSTINPWSSESRGSTSARGISRCTTSAHPICLSTSTLAHHFASSSGTSTTCCAEEEAEEEESIAAAAAATATQHAEVEETTAVAARTSSAHVTRLQSSRQGPLSAE